jgi:hypothetical protein
MTNARLQILLDRCPLSREDCHNIAAIFSALTPERQQHILDNWETYIIEMVMIRKEADTANKLIVDEALEMIDTMKDAKNAHEAEMRLEKYKKQKQTRSELDGIQKYYQAHKMHLIQQMSAVPKE